MTNELKDVWFRLFINDISSFNIMASTKSNQPQFNGPHIGEFTILVKVSVFDKPQLLNKNSEQIKQILNLDKNAIIIKK